MENITWGVMRGMYLYNPSNEILDSNQRKELASLINDIDVFVGFGNKLLELLALSEKEEVSVVSFDISPGLIMQMLITAYYDINPDAIYFNSQKRFDLNAEEADSDLEFIIFREFAITFFSEYLNSQPLLLQQLLDDLDTLLVNIIIKTRIWHLGSKKLDIYYYIHEPMIRQKILNAINARRIIFFPTDLSLNYIEIEEYINAIDLDLNICFYVSNTNEHAEVLGAETSDAWVNRIYEKYSNLKVIIATSFAGKDRPTPLQNPQISFGDSGSYLFQAQRK